VQSPYSVDFETVERVFAPWLDLPVWVNWAETPSGHGGKPHKVPAPKINAPTLLTYWEAKGHAQDGSRGLGIVFGRKETRGLGGLDPDNSRDRATGEISEPTLDLLQEWDTYAEVSPSGTGVKAYALGAPRSLPFNMMHSDELSFECYAENRFFAVTGRHVEGTPDAINLCEAQWRDLVPKLKRRKAAADKEAAGRDDWLFKLACSMRARNVPENAIWAAMQKANAEAGDKAHPNFTSAGPLDEKALRTKFRQAMKYEPGPSKEEDQPSYDPGAEGPIPVGYYKDGATFALYDQKRRLLLPPLSSDQLMASNKLVGFAPPEFWSAQFPAKQGIFNSYRAGVALIAACKQAGPFDPMKVRGRGVWREGDRVVVNLGETVPPGLPHTYLCFKGIQLGTVANFDAAGLLQMWRVYRWEDPNSAVLLLGWAFCAPLAGMLAWRPHGFVFGEAGGGKTAVCHDLGRLLEPMCIATTGESSEAGIRQELAHDALPVIIDDFDSDKDNEESKRVYRLMRAASSAEASTLRGTAEGRAIQFIPRTMFLLGGINVKGQLPQDEDRIVRLKLLKHASDRAEGEKLARLRAQFHQLGRQWCAYVVANAAQLQPAIAALDLALQEKNQRTRLTFATLLAGAFVALHGRAPTEAEAREWAWTYRATVQRHADEKGDRNNAQEAWAHLLAHIPFGERHSLGAHLWFMMSDNAAETLKARSKRVLWNHGLDVGEIPEGRSLTRVVLLANPTNAPAVNKLYERTPWADGAWKEALRTLAGASAFAKPAWHCGKTQRGTIVPFSYVPDAEDLLSQDDLTDHSAPSY
jgi:hypothetical protein